MPFLVTGGSGQVGTALRKAGFGARYPTRAELDLADPASISAYLDGHDLDGIINCAAYTAVDRAETEEALATRVNGAAVGELASHAAARNIPFVTYSTDYVFAGTASRPYVESDTTDPINAYGRSKLTGERLALEASERSLIVRTSWVISGTHRNFVATMLDLAAKGDVRVVDDQHGCPTVADDLAAGTLRLVEAGATGIVHMTNHPPATWFDLARTAVGLAGMDPGRIIPCTTEDFPRPAPRPRFSVLASERLAGLGVAILPDWRDSLRRVVADLGSLSSG